MSKDHPLLTAALIYREAGLSPIPVAPRGKKPLVEWGEFQTRQPTVEEITSWWTLEPQANIALVMGHGIFAVDMDGPEGQLALAAAGIDVSGAPCSRTARGHHYFFAGTAPDRIGLFPQVDIRGVGYVVAPPSVHESGKVYTWERPIAGALPPMPAALEVALRRPLVRAQLPLGLDWFTAALNGVSAGTRDDTCTRLAGYLLGKGLPRDAADIILQAWAERCTPPFPGDQVSKCVESIAKREAVPEGPPQPLAEALDRVLLDIASPAGRPGIASTHFASLDEALAGGLHAGEYALLGAPTSVGKTALALQWARMTAKAGRGVLVCSREMPVSAIVRRLLAQECQIDSKRLKTGELSAIERTMLDLGQRALRPLPIWITDRVGTMEQLSDAVAMYQPGVLALLICDYVQLMRLATRNFTARERVGEVSKELRRLAIETGIPVLGLSSLSRPERGSNGGRGIHDLKESGDLESDADIVFILERELGATDATLKLKKSRDGELLDLKLKFTAKTLTFTEAT